jgi:SAM-dependent methyltransferase
MSSRCSGLPVAEPTGIEEKLEAFLTASQFQGRKLRHLSGRRMKAAQAWSRITGRLGDLVFERGVHTSGHARELAHYHPDRVWYQASGWSYLPRILPKREVGPSDVFADIGSGKGRVLLQAARYPFARVIGVEISAELNAVAEANLERQRGKRVARDIELATADAAGWEVPDDLTVAYMYYPFVGDTFRQVIDNLVESLERAPRRLRLVYALPEMEEYVLGTGLFAPVRSARIMDIGVPHWLTLYEADPTR